MNLNNLSRRTYLLSSSSSGSPSSVTRVEATDSEALVAGSFSLSFSLEAWASEASFCPVAVSSSSGSLAPSPSLFFLAYSSDSGSWLFFSWSSSALASSALAWTCSDSASVAEASVFAVSAEAYLSDLSWASPSPEAASFLAS